MINEEQELSNRAKIWLSNEISNIPNFIEATKEGEDDAITKNVIVPPLCEIALFKYNAKQGNVSGYWDKFPLVIIVRPLNDHFYGFNLHYLDYETREKIISIIKRFKREGDTRSTFKYVYPFLDALVKMGKYNYAYKNYSYTRLESKFVVIKSNYYDLVSRLPIARLKENN